MSPSKWCCTQVNMKVYLYISFIVDILIEIKKSYKDIWLEKQKKKKKQIYKSQHLPTKTEIKIKIIYYGTEKDSNNHYDSKLVEKLTVCIYLCKQIKKY